MHVAALTASNLRCLELLEYLPAGGLNLVCGANGTGKTTLLEAIAVVGLGRSFLTNRIADLVRYGQPGMSVRAHTISELGHGSEVLVRREGARTHIEHDGVPVYAASVLARNLPLLVLNTRAAELLTDGPGNRRALLDRTMFHVEPTYGGLWKRYRHVLRQRNALVRRRRRHEAAFWSVQLGELSERIDSARRRVVEVVNRALDANPVSSEIEPLTFDYHPGWSAALPLAEQLERTWQRDCDTGHTGLGSHRADLTLRAGGRSVGRRLSRGQGKFVVAVVIAALAEFVTAQTGRSPLMLVDDLAAELDDMMRFRAVEMIMKLGSQCFFTAIKARDLPEVEARVDAVFHVEQRRVSNRT